jgi:hypothetical protein
MKKSEMIENSLACSRFGYLSLIPVAGIVCALISIRYYAQTLFASEQWNPAKWCLLRGAGCAVVGLLLHAVVITLLFKL